jgi:hypothetical protein
MPERNLQVKISENFYILLALPQNLRRLGLGQEIPVPAFNAEDFTPASASGKVLARLPRSMHMQLKARAKTEGVSLNALVLAFIAEGLGRRNVAHR